ncbi:hypothetical protein AX14_005004 [Amanita brunnescens Koide BX004]|nr:hypothetical protein AX14_005004 [Amanita brunnescens Koide BX004]
MMFLHAVIVFILATLAFGQNVIISHPPPGTSVRPKQRVRVQIAKPDSLSSSLEIGVAIAIVSCAARDCFNPQDFFGDVLYHGGYDPVQVFNTRTTLYQNFTVEIPAGFAKGPAQLNVAHSGLIGAGFIPYIQVLNQTLNVE